MFIGVDGCEMYCGVCSSRFSVYVYFYVFVSSDDCEVEKVDVAVGFYSYPSNKGPVPSNNRALISKAARQILNRFHDFRKVESGIYLMIYPFSFDV